MTCKPLIPVRAGFLPLVDAALLIVAYEKGLAREEGIDLHLSRETSWANIRDRLSVGHFDVAHMLAPLPIAANLGLSPLDVPFIAPMALGLGGNAVTVSTRLWTALAASGASSDGDPLRVGSALGAVISARRDRGERPLTFAVVQSFSGHHYELRYWLAACGIDPDRDIAITVVPPPLMVAALKSGRIDGYCVGEPWNTAAVQDGSGRIVTTKSSIWRSSPEKVLGVTKEWAEANPGTLAGLLRALHRASLWCDDKNNAAELAAILAGPSYLDLPEALLLPAITNEIALGDSAPRRIDDFLIFAGKAATFPWQSHALWFYSQMVRWGQVTPSAERILAARLSYRPDLYRHALSGLGVAMPGASSKIEGALSERTHLPASRGQLVLGPDGFFDGVIFDPDRIEDYIAAAGIHAALHKN
ncbi:CmpA/NrtA family ABC transporter substrate-binding protein [Taklimakanibacter lacteus]|uniref:CmpA/NrtA family ABC transporter substrate-binding protein n=1 Tax=Taklimakanibacter lacteus TaxID=2268456 RepID=UPI000E673CF5